MKKVCVSVLGCSAAQSQGERVRYLLRQKYELADKPESAEAIVLLVCSLKSPTENSMLRFIHKYNKKFIIAGCFPLSFPNHKALKSVSLVGTNDLNRIAEAIDKTLNGELVKFLSKDKRFLECAHVRDNPLIAKIEISRGCLSNCTFCSEPWKGELKSRSVGAIVEEVKRAVSEGCKEIWLTSQDCSCYGFDIKTNIVELVKRIVAIDGDFRVRIGMMNPELALRLTPELVELYKNPKVYKFLHIPVQSGSDRVLKLMNRDYSVADFKKILELVRSVIPTITIWTDVICGFPTEQETEFKAGLKLIEEAQPDNVNISRFWARPGIKASELKQSSKISIKRRSEQMNQLFRGIKQKRYESWIGKRCEVLITDQGNKPNQWKGRNECYIPVVVKSEKNILGRIISVKIQSISQGCLLGIIK